MPGGTVLVITTNRRWNSSICVQFIQAGEKQTAKKFEKFC